MNIYFSCSLTGGRSDQSIYAHIVDHLHQLGHVVPTAHLAQSEAMNLERVVGPHEVYSRDIGWIRSADAMIAEVSTPSHGVGYEIAYALQCKKPVLCCHLEGIPVSKMITGNDSQEISVRAYSDLDEAILVVDEFLNRLMN